MNVKPKRKFDTTIILSGAAIVLALVVFFCLSMVNTINERMNESAFSNLVSTTRVISDTFENAIEQDYDALRTIGVTYMAYGSPGPERLSLYRDTLGFDWIGIVDAQGFGTDCLGNQYLMSDYPSILDWDLFNEGYSNAYIGRQSGRPQITIWVPVYMGDEYLGVVLANVILAQYYSSNVFTFYEGAGRTYVFDASNGEWILKSLGTDGADTWHHNIYSLLAASENSDENISAFRETVETEKSGVAVLNFNGEYSYLCFMPLPSSPNWYITTVIARDALLQESSEVQRIIGWVLVIGCVTLMAAAAVLVGLFVQKTKANEAHYRDAIFSNVSANLDSAFLLYKKSSGEPAFVSDNINRLLGLNRKWISEDVGRLFDWCKISDGDEQRTAFLEGTLGQPCVREIYIENELGEKTRAIRLELIPADLGQSLAVLTDITKDKDIQKSLVDAIERASAANTAKNEFLSSMSHDLRTPINGIVGMTAIAAGHLDDKNRVLDCLSKISDSTAQLLSLINEVLDMAQIESGKLQLSNEKFNLAELLHNTLNVNYPGIKKKNQTLHVHIHLMEHEEVIGDPVRLARIATNLISNAIKYTPSGGEIRLILQEKPAEIKGYGCYELTVQDNGIGMSREFQKRLFQPFEREEAVKISRIQGTGLGLSIVKNLVDLMLGRVTVESKKGEGSTFKVVVNLRLNRRTVKENSRLAGLPVLVVDDDTATCKALTDILCSIGMKGEWVETGAKAVELVSERHRKKKDFMAVLVDWKMPEMDGLETTRRIRAEVGPNVPIIILTSYDWREIEKEAIEAGANAYLSKPIYRAKLLQKMTELVDNAPQTPAEIISIPSGGVFANNRVLLAEDNSLNGEIVLELLRMMGIEADWEVDGAAVVKRFSESEPGTYGLIFMDIQMPIMNGYDATRAIRNLGHPDSRTIPIVAMTADAFKKDVQKAHEAGMNEHISKPISVDRLERTLKRYLSALPD